MADSPQQGAQERTVEPDRVEPGDDLFPKDQAEHQKLVAWCQQAFTAADAAREPHKERWMRAYRLYRSWVERKPGDWRSKVFYPMSFWVVETITPRLVAQLPKFVSLPVGREDQTPAKTMEQLLDWAASNSHLFIELVKGTKSALIYGTGIIKTYWRQDVRYARRQVPVTMPVTVQQEEPLMDPETGEPVIDPDGNPVVESREVEAGEIPIGMRSERYPYVGYDGPEVKCIDLFNFWVAPESEDIQSARYVIHRDTTKQWGYVQERIKEGIYRLPPEMDPGQITANENEPMTERLSSIDLEGKSADATRKPVDLKEFWTDDGRVITLCNDRAILRVSRNPFDHGMKPFVRIVDHLPLHEMWGIGEIESIEGLQDLQNVIVNSRIDNLRLVLQAMFMVDMESLVDQRDLRIRPGGFIRTRGGRPPNEVVQRLDFGDITPSAFAEAQQTQDAVERVTGVTAYTQGLDTPSLNDTATGVSLIQEAGNNRFVLKSRLMELMGLKDIARMWGSLLQQFTTEEKVVRILGPNGLVDFQSFTPESIQGAFDFDIETASSTLTESRRRQDAMTLLQVLGNLQPQALPALVQDVLDSFGKKDVDRYLFPQADQGGPMAQMAQMGQMGPAMAPGQQQQQAPPPNGQRGRPLPTGQSR